MIEVVVFANGAAANVHPVKASKSLFFGNASNSATAALVVPNLNV